MSVGSLSQSSPSLWGKLMMALVSIMLALILLGAMSAPVGTGNNSSRTPKNCPTVDLAKFAIQVTSLANGVPTEFTIYPIGADPSLTGVVYALERGYPELPAIGQKVWHTYVNNEIPFNGISATEMLRAGDLYIKDFGSKTTNIRQIRDENFYSYRSFKDCGNIIGNIFTNEKAQFWAYTIK
jgi:hypothetical protein